jgi:hypothetical protein
MRKDLPKKWTFKALSHLQWIESADATIGKFSLFSSSSVFLELTLHSSPWPPSVSLLLSIEGF